jgi:hypothetical protein
LSVAANSGIKNVLLDRRRDVVAVEAMLSEAEFN